MVYLYNGIPLVIKTDKIWIHTTTCTGESQHESKKPNRKSNILFYSIYINCGTDKTNLQCKKIRTVAPQEGGVRITIYILVSVWMSYSKLAVGQGFEPQGPGPRGHGLLYYIALPLRGYSLGCG